MTTYRFGAFKLDREHLLLQVGEQPLALGPKVVETLLGLIEHPQEVVTKGELLERVWPEGYVEEANLAQNVYVIRKTLRRYSAQHLIETVPRRGYRFTGEVTIETAPAASPVPQPLPSRRNAFRHIAAAACGLLIIVGGASYGLARSRPAIAPSPALSPAGARLYAMGKYYWNQRTASGLQKSEQYFLRVVRSDPKDARGYAALASSYAIEGDYGFGSLGTKAALARAAAYARTALRYDARSAEAYAVLGLVAIDEHRMDAGFANYRRALALDPSYAPAHQWLGAALLMRGSARAGYTELQKAANLDPLSVAGTDWLAQAAFLSRRYDDALAYGRQALDLSPQRYGAYSTIGMAYEAVGNERAAIAAYTTYATKCSFCRYDAAALLAHAYAKLHDTRSAARELNTARTGLALKSTSADNYVAALIALGRKDEALALLARLRLGEPAALLAIDPRMDAVRGDARFRRYTQSPG